MSNINHVTLAGRLVRDPDLRATASGTSVLNFSIAVNDSKKNPQTGQWEDFPNFVDCIIFGNRADGCYRVLSKGMLVCVEGKLRQSTWEREGVKRSKLEVVVNEIEWMSREKTTQPQPQAYEPAPMYDDLPWN